MGAVILSILQVKTLRPRGESDLPNGIVETGDLGFEPKKSGAQIEPVNSQDIPPITCCRVSD